MWIDLLLTVLSTLLGLFALWKHENKIFKYLSSFLLVAILIFSLFRISSVHKEKNQAILEKRQQYILDSTKYANDSIYHLREQNLLPERLSIYFSSSLQFTPAEISQIKKIVKLKHPHNLTNLLPFEFNQTNTGFDKINSFNNIMLQLNILFSKNEKTMSIRLTQGPLMLHGYNAANVINSFMLTLRDSVINFEALNVNTEDNSKL